MPRQQHHRLIRPIVGIGLRPALQLIVYARLTQARQQKESQVGYLLIKALTNALPYDARRYWGHPNHRPNCGQCTPPPIMRRQDPGLRCRQCHQARSACSWPRLMFAQSKAALFARDHETQFQEQRLHIADASALDYIKYVLTTPLCYHKVQFRSRHRTFLCLIPSFLFKFYPNR